MLGRTAQASELSEEEHDGKAYAFFQPLTEEQKAFARHMVKTLPAGDEVPVGEPQS